jgi:hypothetical protein
MYGHHNDGVGEGLGNDEIEMVAAKAISLK